MHANHQLNCCHRFHSSFQGVCTGVRLDDRTCQKCSTSHCKPWLRGYHMLRRWLVACWEPVCTVTVNLHCSSFVLTSQTHRKFWISFQRMCFSKHWFPNFFCPFFALIWVWALKGSRLNREVHILLHSHDNSSSSDKIIKLTAQSSQTQVTTGTQMNSFCFKLGCTVIVESLYS